MLWGIRYKQLWYFDKGIMTFFSKSNLETAKTDYLHYGLKEEQFYKGFQTSSHEFWKRGGGGVRFLPLRSENYLSVFPCYESLPVIVATAEKSYRWKAIDSTPTQQMTIFKLANKPSSKLYNS